MGLQPLIYCISYMHDLTKEWKDKISTGIRLSQGQYCSHIKFYFRTTEHTTKINVLHNISKEYKES